jgi:hypothetical protein
MKTITKYDDKQYPKRHVLLRELEGWYKADPSVPVEFKQRFAKYKASGSNMKPTRWLLKHGYINQIEATVLGEHLNPFSFKLSCRFNDIFRAKKSPHYNSCLNRSMWDQNIANLQDKDLGVVYIPDAAGHFKFRAFVRLCVIGSHFILVVYKPYGNGDFEAVLQTLNKVIPTFKAGYKWLVFNRKTHLPEKKLFLRSATKNAIKQKWCDHPYIHQNDYLYISAHKD